MPTFRITTKNRVTNNGIRVEPGMTVDVVTSSFSNPVTVNGGQNVVDATLHDTKRPGGKVLRDSTGAIILETIPYNLNGTSKGEKNKTR